MTLARRAFCLFAALLLIAPLYQAQAAEKLDKDLPGFSQHLSSVADRCRAATVGIVIPGGSMGSGVIIDQEGLVLTAAHVLPEAGGDVFIVMSDGRKLKAKALGVNRKVDSGMARIIEPGPFPVAPVAATEDVWEGDWVIAFGHGGGVQTDRPAPMRLGRALHVSSSAAKTRWITTDCTVISGDSGGPLFDLQGQVIGIHSNIGMSVLVNRHVPIDAYHKQWDLLLEPKEINILPTPANPLVPGMDTLPEGIQREIERRVKEQGDEFKKQLDQYLNEVGQLVISPEEAAELLGRDDMLEEIRAFREKLADREKRSQQIDGVEGDGQDKPDSDVNNQSQKTRQLIFDKKRERLLEEIAEDLRRTHGKIAEHVLSRFAPAVSASGPSTVEIIARGKVVALGTVIREDGYILTKASELNGPARVRIGDREVMARIVNGNRANDLALLKIDVEGLAPVRWATQTPAVGSLLVVARPDGTPLAMGVVGVDARVIPENVNNVYIAPPPSPFLGVSDFKRPQGKTKGIMVGKVLEDGPAAKAGLIYDDVITAINDTKVDSPAALVKALKKAKIGDTVTVHIQRGMLPLKFEVELGTSPTPTKPEGQDSSKSSAQVYSARGGKLSKRRTNFALAMTHDAVIWANDIGGPILNLDGEAVGINIARYGRTATYAVPADQAQQLIAQMMRGR